MFGKLRSPVSPSEQEIHDELLFHLQSLVDENLAAGMPSQQAWDAAQRRFGSLPAYAAECRPGQRLVRPALALLAAACLLTCGLLGWSWQEVRALRAALGRAQEENAAVASAELAPRQNTLAGKVLDATGQAIAKADVLIIVKTWPEGRYHQQAFAARSESGGAFTLTYEIPQSGPYAVQLAVVKPGYALESIYQLKQRADEPLDAIEIRLAAAAPCALVVRDELGQPIAGARVAPSSRHTTAGQEHMIYFQANRPVQMQADARGRVPMAYFQSGDRAEVYVQVPGRDWQRHTIRIPPEGGDVEISTLTSLGQES